MSRVQILSFNWSTSDRFKVGNRVCADTKYTMTVSSFVCFAELVSTSSGLWAIEAELLVHLVSEPKGM